MDEIDAKYVRIADQLAEAIATAKRLPHNHLAIRQLAAVLEANIDENHEEYPGLAPLFEKLRAGAHLAPIEADALLHSAILEEKYCRTGRE